MDPVLHSDNSILCYILFKQIDDIGNYSKIRGQKCLFGQSINAFQKYSALIEGAILSISTIIWNKDLRGTVCFKKKFS